MAGLSKKYLALIALPLLLAACQTADQQKKRQQQQEAIGAINEFSAQKPAPIDVVISEFETRCKAVVGKEFESIEQAATAAGLETPGVFIPSVGRFRARTMFWRQMTRSSPPMRRGTIANQSNCHVLADLAQVQCLICWMTN